MEQRRRLLPPPITATGRRWDRAMVWSFAAPAVAVPAAFTVYEGVLPAAAVALMVWPVSGLICLAGRGKLRENLPEHFASQDSASDGP